MNPDTQLKILEAAKEVFERDGYHGASVENIVSTVGLAKGTFYNYFKNKRAIFDELLRRFTTDLVGCFESADIEQVEDGASYRQVGMQIGSSVVRLFLENRALARLFFSESRGLDSEADHLIDQTYQRLTHFSETYVKRGQSLEMVRPNLSPQLVAVTMVGVCSYTLDRFLRGEFSDLDPMQILNTIVEIHLKGIMK